MATMMQCSMHGLSSSSPAFAGTKSQLGLPALTKLQGLPSFSRERGRGKGRPLNVQASAKKIKVDEPYGPCGNTNFKDGKDASGRLAKGKGVYQFANKYGANVDGYSPIYDPKDWSASGDVYTGGRTGLIIWAVTLAGLLAVGAFLVYNTSALSG